MRIAHFSPLPPQPTGIADYCAELLPFLGQVLDVDAYASVTAGRTRLSSTAARPIAEFLERSESRFQYDVLLYHMGNHPAHHREIYSTMMRFPGIAVLHDLNLHAFYLHQYTDRDARAAYVRELGYAGGINGTSSGLATLADLVKPSVHDHPLYDRIVHANLGTIVHTQSAKNAILSRLPDANVAYIPLGATSADETDVGPRPPLLDKLPPDVVSLGSFGYIAPSKRIDVVLRALAKIRGSVPDFHYVIAGQLVPGYELNALVFELGLDDVVHLAGHVDAETLMRYLRWIDIGINLRTNPTGGEMSAVLLRLLANGRPVIVSNADGFADLPDSAVWKIGQGAGEIDELANALGQMIGSSQMREAYGISAREYVVANHSFPSIARQYEAFISSCLLSLH